MGPVDYMVVEFPGGRMNGEGLPLLVDLVDKGIVRILDLVFIRKLPDGSFVRMELTERGDTDGEALKVFEGASSGIVDDEDLCAVANVVEAGSTAGMIVYENRWAAPLATSLRRGGAMLVASGRIPVQSLVAALDAAEAASPAR
ncbi:MAG TPA: DUF6325 family protein [Candidatus Dormibacteraeota bacterium]|nr:DUF6325 family protein [Candidatus Dormibacteraeota bacterium]